MLAVMASGISCSMAWAVFGETGYGWILLTSLIFVSLTIPFFSDTDDSNFRNRGGLVLWIALLSFIVHLGNPARAIASYSLPALGGLIALLVASATLSRVAILGRRRARLPFGAWLIGGLIRHGCAISY